MTTNNNLKLYEINQALEDVLNKVFDVAEANEGEIPDVYIKIVDELNLDRTNKILDIARYVKNLNAESKAIKEEADKLYRRYKSLSNFSNRLKEYLTRNIVEGEKIKDSNTLLSWRKSEGVIVTDHNIVPDNYYLIERKVQLSAIKRDIKNGFTIPGVELEERTNLQIK